MDIAEQAAEGEQRFTDRSLAVREQAWREARLPQGVSLTHCLECGDPIAEERRKAVPGCTRCAECQEMKEYRDRIGTRGQR